MLLCTQGVMSTNNFFAAQQLLVYPSCSGGSPMASAPPAAESGGRRSSVSPLSTSRAGDDSKMWPTCACYWEDTVNCCRPSNDSKLPHFFSPFVLSRRFSRRSHKPEHRL